jgi:RNA-directed DNA polymerase
VLEADIHACFDEIGHAPLLARMRHRIKDKQILGLVKAFLKSGVMTSSGNRDDADRHPTERDTLPAASQYRAVGVG